MKKLVNFHKNFREIFILKKFYKDKKKGENFSNIMHLNWYLISVELAQNVKSVII